MSKKQESIEFYNDLYNQNISDADTGEYIKEIMVRYGVNVSVFRACPMIIDGLTPGQRRRLYTFYKKGATPDKPRFKVDDLLGPVTGLHPHGKQSIEASFTNDIKSWETNVEVYDVNGNTGSLTGDRAAATRYLEARLSKYAMKCFFDEFDPDIADMVPSNNRRDLEPVSIPTKYPHFLFSLATGIAWGNAISLPPFNVNEVCDLTIALIKNPSMTNVYLYPDSPRGYDIIESERIGEICDSGRGSLKIQARMDVYEDETIGKYIEVKGFTEQTNMNSIMKKISEMVINKEINGIDTLADKAHIDDVKFWIILKKDAEPQFIINTLYKKTGLRSNVDIGMNFAGRTSMQQVGLKHSLLLWIENRINFKHRIYLKQLNKKKSRIQELDGIIMMLSKENREATTKIISESNSDKEAIENLINYYKDYNITSYQAASILEIKLSRISRGNQDKYKEEQDKLRDEIKEIFDIVTSREKIKNKIIEELNECKTLFGRPRQCRIVSPEVLEPPVYKFNIVITQKYIKKLSPNSVNVGIVEPDDEVVAVFNNVPETSQIYAVDTLGKIYNIKLSKVKSHELVSKGDDLQSLVGLKGKVIKGFKVDKKHENIDTVHMVFFMQSGIMKRTPLSQYVTNRVELQGAVLNKDDFVSYATLIDTVNHEEDDSHVLMYTKNGLGIAMDLNEVTVTDRLTKGSKYLKLEDGDEIQGVCELEELDNDILVITSKGYAKFCEINEIIKTTKRRADMIRLTGLNNEDTVFKIIPWHKDYKKIQCVLQSGNKVDLNPTEVENTTRVSKGKKYIPVKRGDAIVKIKLIK